MRNLEYYPVEGANSLWHWPKFVNPLKVIKNFLIIQICRYSPSLRLKILLSRLFLRSKVGKNTSLGLMVMFDIFFPERIKIGENVIVGYNSTILCHECIRHEYRLGDVVIEDNVTIGANTTILPGVTIGEGAVVSSCSLVNKNVPPNSFVGGIPAKPLKRIS
ncbi:MAG: acyltransferase [Clostridia bacterium]|nr:acyltransferase [Clostridia bacterium]